MWFTEKGQWLKIAFAIVALSVEIYIALLLHRAIYGY